MALPLGAIGSLTPTFVSARLVCLAVKRPFAFYTLRLVSIQPEGTFARLRYLLGGDRPSQTAHLSLFPHRLTVQVRVKSYPEWYFTGDSTEPSGPASQSPTYPTQSTT